MGLKGARGILISILVIVLLIGFASAVGYNKLDGAVVTPPAFNNNTGSVNGSATVTVTETLVLSSIVISPDGATLTTGETQQFTAVGYDQNGDVIDAVIVFSVEGNGSIVDGLYTAADAGTDSVVATSGAVISSVVVTVEGTEAISSINSINVNMYPNPVSNILTVDLAGHSCNKVALLNANGKIVYVQANIQSEEKLEIDVQHLPTGIYFIILEDDVTSYSYTISKQ